MPPHPFGNGEHSIGNAGHQPVGDTLLRCPQESHIATSPYQICLGHDLSNKPPKNIRASKKRVDESDPLLLEEPSKLEGGSEGHEVKGALQWKLVDRTRRKLQGSALRMGRKSQDGRQKTVVREVLREL